jgi:Domain of unknown function (DUF4911)
MGSPDRVAGTPTGLPFGAGLVARRVLVAPEHVSFLRGVLEAEDGLAFMHGDGTGAVWVLAPEARSAELDALVHDLVGDGCLQGVYDPAPI